MVQVDLPGAIAVGQIFAFLSKDYLKNEPRLLTSRLLGAFNVLVACAYVPVGMFLLIGWPAWEVMYVSSWPEDPANRPWVAAFYVAFAVAMIVLANVGYIVGHIWLRKGKEHWVKIGIALSVGLTVLPFLLRWGIWRKVGTYAEVVEDGAGYYFLEQPFVGGWLFFMSFMFGSIGLVGWLFKTRGNRIRN